MYVTQNSENTSLVDLTIVANGKVALPEDSYRLFSFYSGTCDSISNVSLIEFNNSVDTSKAKNMNEMFAQVGSAAVFQPSSYSTKTIKSLNLSGFDTSSVENMNAMFRGISVENIYLSSFDTSKVTDMGSMFEASKTTELDLNGFDTSNVTNMFGMFRYSNITEIKGLNKFNTSKVTNMYGMFAYSTVTALDLGSFDTSNVTNMNNMFIDSKVTTGYARTQADADKFNNSSNKPSGLTFTVK